MRTRTFLRVTPAVAMAVVATLVTAPSAHAGLIDGSLNNLHAADGSNILAAMVQSNINLDHAGNNGREGHATNRSLRLADADGPQDRCEATVTVTDSNGASGTATVAVPSSGYAETAVNIPDQVPGTAWHGGDVDHVAGQLVCYDARTGAMLSMVALDEDRPSV